MSNNNQQLENFALDLVEQVREGGNEMERLILENAELKKENEHLQEKWDDSREENQELREKLIKLQSKHNAFLEKDLVITKESGEVTFCLHEAIELMHEWKENMLPFIELGEKIKARGKKQLEDPIGNNYGECFERNFKTSMKTKRLLDFMDENNILGKWSDVKKKD